MSDSEPPMMWIRWDPEQQRTVRCGPPEWYTQSLQAERNLCAVGRLLWVIAVLLTIAAALTCVDLLRVVGVL